MSETTYTLTKDGVDAGNDFHQFVQTAHLDFGHTMLVRPSFVFYQDTTHSDVYALSEKMDVNVDGLRAVFDTMAEKMLDPNDMRYEHLQEGLYDPIYLKRP